MKVFFFSDIHYDISRVKEVIGIGADLFVFCGDLSVLGEGLEESAAALSPIKNRLLIIPGNNETVEQVKVLCDKFEFTFLHEKTFKVGKYVFAGLGYSNIMPFNTPGMYEEDVIKEKLEKFKGKKNLILITHAPPKDCSLDLLNDKYVGSSAVREFIDRAQPTANFSGHLHNNEGKICVIGKTVCFNCGKNGFLVDF